MLTKIEKHASKDSPKPSLRFVGLFDVLGFSDLITNKSLDSIATEYYELLRNVDSAVQQKVFSPTRIENWHIPYAIFSDTILCWSDDSQDAVLSFLETCAGIVSLAIKANLPVRGGIAFGECIMNRDTNTFIGEPIVTAHQTEQATEWIGAAIHDSCLNAQTGAILEHHQNVVQYAVPMKSGHKYKGPPLRYAIRWPILVSASEMRLHSLAKKAPAIAKDKYDATLKFFQDTSLH